VGSRGGRSGDQAPPLGRLPLGDLLRGASVEAWHSPCAPPPGKQRRQMELVLVQQAMNQGKSKRVWTLDGVGKDGWMVWKGSERE